MRAYRDRASHDEIKLAQNKRAAVVRCEAVANADIDVGMKRWAPDQDRVAKADVARRIEFRHLAGLFDRSGVQVGGAEPDRIWRHVNRSAEHVRVRQPTPIIGHVGNEIEDRLGRPGDLAGEPQLRRRHECFPPRVADPRY